MEREIETSMWQERMLAAISRIFAALALVAGIGLSGMIAFTLARRTREVGIRMAVGATPRNIARLFARQAGSAVVPGILGGLAGFVLVRRGLDPLLFGKGAEASVAWRQARFCLRWQASPLWLRRVVRATRIQPTNALREE